MTQIEDVIRTISDNKDNLSNIQLWDYLKCEICTTTVEFMSSKDIEIIEAEISSHYFLLNLADMSDQFYKDVEVEIYELSMELHEIFDSQLDKEKSTCNVDYYGNFETCCKAFFARGKSQKLDMTMYKVQLEDGTLLKDPDSVLTAQENFYSTLYQSTNPESHSHYQVTLDDLLLRDHPKLSSVDSEAIQQHFVIEEFYEALASMPLG